MICTGNCEFCRIHKELNYESLLEQQTENVSVETSTVEIAEDVTTEEPKELSLVETPENYVVTKRFRKLVARKQ